MGRARIISTYILVGLLFVLFIFLLRAAHAHDASMAQSPEELRVFKFYKTWMRPPDRKMSCCSDHDCHEVQVKREQGKWFFYDPGMQLWREIPEDRIESNAAEPRESPDGMNHVCYNTMYVLCAVLGSGQ